ncbi:MAG: InlB B-repeat-containing protein [Ignavibacteriales bacterium]
MFRNQKNRILSLVLACLLVISSIPLPVYAVEMVDIFFDSQGGTDVGMISTEYGTTINEPEAPFRPGYNFDGWYKESGCINEWNFDTDTVTENIMLFAKWSVDIPDIPVITPESTTYDSPQDILININADLFDWQNIYYTTDGNTPNTESFMFNEPFSLSLAEDSITTVKAAAYDEINGEWSGIASTIYAVGTSCVVLFDSQGGSDVESISVDPGEKISEPAAPTKSGYKFSGWYKESNCINRWNFGTDTVTSNITLYAKWTHANSGSSGNTTVPPTTPINTTPIPIERHLEVKTIPANDITLTQACLNGSIVNTGEASCTKVNFRYRVMGSSDWKDTNIQYVSLGNGAEFSDVITGLAPNTKYEFMARAYNTIEWAEGEIHFFETTSAVLPKVTTSAASEVNMTSAILNGIIADNGGGEIADSGFILSDPELGNNTQFHVAPGTEKNLTYNLTGLAPNKKFYYRAYAVNKAGIAYGDMVSFQTKLTQLPVVTTFEATEIDTDSVTLNGKAVISGGKIIDCGFQISSFTGKAHTQPGSDGTFSIRLNNLQPGTTYNFQAFASTASDNVYASVLSFTTLTNAPQVETRQIDELQGTKAALSGFITKNHGFAITESGFFWGTDSKPDKKVIVNPTGSEGRELSYNLTELQGCTTYYIQAYAVNSQGIGYGNVIKFSTTAAAPQVTTISADFSDENWIANLSGSVNYNGGSEIIEYGFKYSSNKQDWTTLIVGKTDHNGSFVYAVQGASKLLPGTYYVQAYAVNSVNTGLGKIVSFTTSKIPTVICNIDNASITSSSVTLTGNIVDAGGEKVTITARQFQYRVEGSKDWLSVGIESGTFGTGNFRFIVPDLKIGTNYEFRAQAYNSAGWGTSEAVKVTIPFGNSDKEAAVNMKLAGFSISEIVLVLKDTFGDSDAAAMQSLIYAGFGLEEIVMVLKGYPYKDNAQAIANAMYSAGYDADNTAGIIKKYFEGEFYSAGYRKDLDRRAAYTLAQAKYTANDVAKALKDIYNDSAEAAISALGKDYNGGNFSTDDIYGAIYAVYGLNDLKNWIWSYYRGNEVLLIQVLKKVGVDAVTAAETGKSVLNNIDRICYALKSAGYSLSDTGIALIKVFGAGADAIALYLPGSVFTKPQVEEFLVKDMNIDAQQMINVTTARWYYSYTDGPRILSTWYKLNAFEMAKTLYSYGWTEANDGLGPKKDMCGLYGIIYGLEKVYNIKTGNEIITVLKQLGLSPLAVANEMDFVMSSALGSSLTDGRDWLKMYKNQDYSATDAAAWFKSKGTIYGITMAKLKPVYDLTDIVLAIRNIYNLDSSTALKEFKNYNRSYSLGWTDAAIENAVKTVYGADPIMILAQDMKASGALASQTASTLRSTFIINDSLKMAEYLSKAGYEKKDVLNALATVFNISGNISNVIQMLNQVLSEIYQQTENTLPQILDAFGAVTPEKSLSVLNALKYSLEDITRVLKDIYKMTAIQSVDFLKLRGYNQADINAAVEKVYGVDPMLALVMSMKEAGDPVEKPMGYLKDMYKVSNPEKICAYLYQAGYKEAEMLKQLIYKFHNNARGVLPGLYTSKEVAAAEFKAALKTITGIENNVFHQERDAILPLLDAIGASDASRRIMALYNSGYSLVDITKVLRDTNASVLQAVGSLKYTNNYTITDIISVVRDVYGVDPIPAVATWLKNNRKNAYAVLSELSLYGVTDIIKNAEYIEGAGFSEQEVLDAIVFGASYLNYDDKKTVIAVMLKVYNVPNDALSIIKTFKEYLNSHYSIRDISAAIQQTFPGISIAQQAIAFRDAGYSVSRLSCNQIFDWLHSYTPQVKDDELIAILGTANQGDLGMEAQAAAWILRSRGYDEKEAAEWLKKDKYSLNDIFENLAKEYFGWFDRVGELIKLLRDMGYTRDEIAAADYNCFRYGTSYSLLMNDLHYGGYSAAEVTEAAVNIGASIDLLPEELFTSSRDWFDYYNHNFGELLECKDIAKLIYDALGKNTKRKDTMLDLTRGLLNPVFSKDNVFRALRSIGSKAIQKAGEQINDSNLSTGGILEIMKEAGVVDIDVLVNIMKNDGTDWYIAIVILGNLGYSFGDSFKAVWNNPSYHNVMGYQIISLMQMPASFFSPLLGNGMTFWQNVVMKSISTASVYAIVHY